MNKEDSEVVYSSAAVEFVTVAAEYCAYLEQSQGREQSVFIDTLLKIMPLLYVKASLLPVVEEAEEFYPETFVTEQDYDAIRHIALSVLGEADSYLDLANEMVRFTDETVMRSLSEDFADIYQALRNFVEVYRIGNEENMYEAIAQVQNSFSLYWGFTLLCALRTMHRLKNSPWHDDEGGYHEQHHSQHCCENHNEMYYGDE